MWGESTTLNKEILTETVEKYRFLHDKASTLQKEIDIVQNA